MITTDFSDYSFIDNKEHFQNWYKEHCHDCWFYGFGNCTLCEENKKLIEGYFDERDKAKNKR